MAERRIDRQNPEQYDETVAPQNPPNSVVEPELSQTPAFAVVGTWYYLGPIVLLLVVLGVGLFFWADRNAEPEDAFPAVGTAGEPQREATPGGFDPDRRPDSTRDELEYRGVGEPPQGPMPGLADPTPLTDLNGLGREGRTTAGRRIDVQNVEVAEVKDATHFWIQDGNVKAEVIAPAQSPTLRQGIRVNVSGVVEKDDQGGARIRATRITAK